MGFRKMTFLMPLIFTFLACKIFRPLFSTLCSCFVIIYMDLLLSTRYYTCFFLNFFFRKKYTRNHRKVLFITFLKAKNCLPHSMHVTAQDVCGILYMLRIRRFFFFLKNKCCLHSLYVWYIVHDFHKKRGAATAWFLT